MAKFDKWPVPELRLEHRCSLRYLGQVQMPIEAKWWELENFQTYEMRIWIGIRPGLEG